MSTRSRIGYTLPDGSIKSIYCHWDGYLAHSGRILSEHYNTLDKVKSLVELGNLSSLGENLGYEHSFGLENANYVGCIAYGRDRNQANTKPIIHDSLEAFLRYREAFNYLFDRDTWRVFDGLGDEISFKV